MVQYKHYRGNRDPILDHIQNILSAVHIPTLAEESGVAAGTLYRLRNRRGTSTQRNLFFRTAAEVCLALGQPEVIDLLLSRRPRLKVVGGRR